MDLKLGWDKQRHLYNGGSIAANTLLFDYSATAFAEFGVNLAPYRDGNHLLLLENTTGGYMALGWISATAPGGLTKGANLLTSWTNLPAVPYETFTTSGANISAGVSDGTGGYGYTNILNAAATGKLFELATTLTLTSGTAPYFSLATSNDGAGFIATAKTLLAAGANSIYLTWTAANAYAGIWNNATAGNWAMASTTIKQVTDVAASGALILATRGGSRGWWYRDASFDPAAALRYRIMRMTP